MNKTMLLFIHLPPTKCLKRAHILVPRGHAPFGQHQEIQKIHSGGPELGFWGFNPFVILIFATLDYCRFPWLK